MSVLHPARFKEFGSWMCLWQALKLWKMQLEVRSLNVTGRRDLLDHRVIVFFGNVPNCWLNRYGKFGGATRRRFFAICEKPEEGPITAPASRARGSFRVIWGGGGGRYPPPPPAVRRWLRPPAERELTRAQLGGYFEPPPSRFLAISSKPLQVSPPNLQYPLSQHFYTLC